MKTTLTCMLLISCLVAFSQKDHFAAPPQKSRMVAPSKRSSEIGLFLGTSYYTGELNPGGHFKLPFIRPGVGLIFRRNLNSRFAFKFDLAYGRMAGDDAEGDTPLQQNRNLSFFSPLIEGTGQVEFNFFPYCAADNKQYYTPYVFAGLGGFWFKPSVKNNSGKVVEQESANYSNIQPSFPFGLGAKIKTSHRILIAVEWGLRKTNTDYLEEVSTIYPDSGQQRGNSKTNDWFSFAGLILTIRLGEKPNTCPNFERIY